MLSRDARTPVSQVEGVLGGPPAAVLELGHAQMRTEAGSFIPVWPSTRTAGRLDLTSAGGQVVVRHRGLRSETICLGGAALWLSACVVPPLSLQSKSCPCADGWVCDTRTNVCLSEASTQSRSSRADVESDDQAPRLPPVRDPDASTPDSVIDDPNPLDQELILPGEESNLRDAGDLRDSGDLPNVEGLARKTCSEIICQGNAHCREGANGATCECDPGFADSNRDGVCKPSCTTAICDSSEICVEYADAAKCLKKSASCAALLAETPNATSGTYSIDPDGPGGDAAMNVQCDMQAAGGGFTQIAAETFESGVAPGWSDGRVDTKSDCAARFGAMVGGAGVFGRGAATSKTFSLHGIPHSELRISVAYVVLDSWDDEAAKVLLDDVVVVEKRFTPGTEKMCGGAFVDYGRAPLVTTVAHSANLARVTISSDLDSTPWDESFGFTEMKIWVR